uniref:Tail protein n=1 Tax=Myoviridae sp. ctIyl4 TaxID=2825078 RepID=A0A8S5PN55_9CAUD|nr:MAG TPA: tail protein [Myoviridae sp. ctIyl4]
MLDSLLDRLSGSLKKPLPAPPPTSHPVTRPNFVLTYEQKDITASVEPYLLSFSYTDYLGEQSDELQLHFEDVDGRWLRTWFPEQGDKLSIGCGDQFTGLINWGSFELAEIEWQRNMQGGDVVSLKALSTGIRRANRTLQPKAYENMMLADIVNVIAARLKLTVSGSIKPIKIQRITQYQERDVEFLARLAKQYGHTFKIVDKKLVFTRNDALSQQEAVLVMQPENLLSIRLRDLIKGTPDKAVVKGYDAKKKRAIRAERKTQPLRGKAKRHTSGDTLKITANKGESQAETNARADAALQDAQEERCAGNITLFGNALLVAGQVIELQRMGKLSGRYLVKQARHDYSKSRGYITDLEIKMVEYIAEESEHNDAPAQP